MAHVPSHSQAAAGTAVPAVTVTPIPASGDKTIISYASLTSQHLVPYPFVLRQLHPRNASEAANLG